MSDAVELLRALVAERVLVERKRRKKPGGPRTDIGALRQLNPEKFRNKVRAAVNTHAGDADQAAHELGVARRTLYHYLDDEKSLHTVKTTEDRAEAEQEEREEREKKGH